MEVLKNCPVCNQEKTSLSFELIDYSISKELFTIFRCQTCGLLFTNPRPEKEKINRYYESPAYISHSNSSTGIINKAYLFVRQFSINKKIKLIDNYSSTNSVLDIGCGTGEFLKECKKQNWATKGIEPNDIARNYCVNNYSLDVFPESEINSIPSNTQDLVTMWHALEHIHALSERIKSIHNILKPNCFAIVALPNHTSFDARYYQKYWAAYDVPRHLYHFSPDNIKYLFKKNDFEWVKSFPMKFDSFYVSILSEKYKGGRLSILKGVAIGLISNLKAGRIAEKYSSVIYVFRKK